MFPPVIYHQALFAPGEALSAMGIEKSIAPQLHAVNPTAKASMESSCVLTSIALGSPGTS